MTPEPSTRPEGSAGGPEPTPDPSSDTHAASAPSGAESRGTVVVGCDGSWESLVAVEAAATEASVRGSELVLLAVADVESAWAGPLGRVADAEAEALQSAMSTAVAAQQRAHWTDPEVPTRVVVTSGAQQRDLGDLVDAADLLVVGGHGGHGQIAFAMGSTSAELGRALACPVLVPRLERRPETPPGRPPGVVVAVRGGTEDQGLVALAAREAVLHRCGLVVVHVATGTGEPRGPRDHASRLGWEQTWETVRSVPESAGVPARVVVTRGDAATALVAETRHHDLLVVGTRGQGRLAGLVEESVARRVVHELPCDVMVVPPGRARVPRLPVAAHRATRPAATSDAAAHL